MKAGRQTGMTAANINISLCLKLKQLKKSRRASASRARGSTTGARMRTAAPAFALNRESLFYMQ